MGMIMSDEEECKERGGHFWNFYDDNTPVDKYGRAGNTRYLMAGPRTNFRRCGFCLRTEREIPAKWEFMEEQTKELREKNE